MHFYDRRRLKLIGKSGSLFCRPLCLLSWNFILRSFFHIVSLRKLLMLNWLNSNKCSILRFFLEDNFEILNTIWHSEMIFWNLLLKSCVLNVLPKRDFKKLYEQRIQVLRKHLFCKKMPYFYNVNNMKSNYKTCINNIFNVTAKLVVGIMYYVFVIFDKIILKIKLNLFFSIGLKRNFDTWWIIWKKWYIMKYLNKYGIFWNLYLIKIFLMC